MAGPVVGVQASACLLKAVLQRTFRTGRDIDTSCCSAPDHARVNESDLNVSRNAAWGSAIHADEDHDCGRVSFV